MNTIRRHATAKRWAPSASLLLATALLLLALSPGAHAAATLGAAHGDAAFLLLREIQCAAQNDGELSLAQLASDDENEQQENAVALASTREFQRAAEKQSRAPQTFNTLCFAPQNARDLSPQIETRATSARDLAPHLSHRLIATSARAFLAAAPRFAPRAIPHSLREYSQQFHSAAYRNGVRSNAFPQ